MEKSLSQNICSLKDQLKEIYFQKDAFEKEISTYAKENKTLKDQIAKLKSARDDADSKSLQTLKEIKDLHRRKEELKEAEFKSTLSEKDSFIKELQGNLTSLKHQIEKCKILDKENQTAQTKCSNQIATLKDKVNKLEKENAQKDKEITSNKNDIDKKSSQQRIRIHVLEDQLHSARSDKETINKELTQLMQRSTSNQSKLETDLMKKDEIVCSLQKQIETLQKKLSSKESAHLKAVEDAHFTLQEDQAKRVKQIKQLEEKVIRLEDEMRQKETQIKVISRQLQSEQSKSSDSTSEFEIAQNKLRNQLLQLKEDCQEKDKKYEKVLKDLRQSNTTNRSLKVQHQNEILSLEDKLTQLNRKLQDKDGEICSLSNKIAILEKKDETFLTKHSTQLERVKTELDQITDENNSKDRKIQKLKRQIDSLESESQSSSKQHQLQITSLEKKLAILKKENQDKQEEISRISSKLSDAECESESLNTRSRYRFQALEEKAKRFEKELKLKNEELCSINSQLSNQQIEVQNMSSFQATLTKTLEDKILKLEAENQSKEEDICKLSSRLTREELDRDSASSKFRIQIRTQAEKLEKLHEDVKQKDEQLLLLESQFSDKSCEIHGLKNQLRRLELEKKSKEDDLNKFQSLELEQASKSVEDLSQIRILQNTKRKLESEIAKMKLTVDMASDKASDCERKLELLKKTLQQKEQKLAEANDEVEKYQEEIGLKIANEQNLQCKVKSLTNSNQELRTEIERLNDLKMNLVNSVEDLSEKLKKEEHEKKILQAKSSACLKLSRTDTEQKSLIESQKKEIENLKRDLEKQSEQASLVKKENDILTDKCQSLQSEMSLHSTTESQLKAYKEQIDKLQKANVKLDAENNDINKENKDLKRKASVKEREVLSRDSEVEELNKMVKLLKDSCVMLEKQVEDLESFNNDLIEKQRELGAEKDNALEECSELRFELSSAKHEMETELDTLDQCNNDQISDLRVELRNEINQLHEVTEEYRDLQLKYKNLELNAAALQRKLNNEKDGHERCLYELERFRGEREVLQQSLKRAEENLHDEVDRCDELEREKTQLMNRAETEKLEYSHELVRLNCQGAQQTKLIDFLQSRIEELEPLEKKKKKKKTTLYQAPLQYRELCDLLEEEKASNVKLQEQVNTLRSELQSSNSKVKRLKHGMEVPLSPGSIAAISAIVRSPATASTDGVTSPKAGKLRSKPRMHHNIPHRMNTWICHSATRCSVCLAAVHFGHSALKCSECSIICHNKCRSSITNTCGLPGGLFQQFKEGPKTSTMSPITCVFKGNNSDLMQGKLKVLCGDDSWAMRSVRIVSDQLRIALPCVKSPSKVSDKDDVIDLKQASYIHTDIKQSELPGTAKQDLSYAFKIQSGSSSSCWPARTVYLLAAGFAEKHLWVGKLEEIVARYGKSKNISGNGKILGNEILCLLGDEKLEVNCSLPLSDKTILFGCEEGLYKMRPTINSKSSKADMKRVDGFTSVYQLTALSKTSILAIEGEKHRLVSFNTITMESNSSVTLQCIENIEGCHLFTVGQAEGLYYLCIATATTIIVLKYHEKMKKFCKKKEIASTQPCTCMIFTACSIIVGTNKFYEIDLTEFKIDEFVDDGAAELLVDEMIFPVAVLKIKQRDGKQEFLLCFHEFGIFVDGFGRSTRQGRIVWSRMPLSFEYKDPYLIVIQFNSVEIILLDVDSSSPAETCKLDRGFLSFPRVRYLGSAITEGAVYLCSSDSNRASVFCCKGNMNQPTDKVASAPKRHIASLSSSLDSLSSPVLKRSVMLSDISALSSVKSPMKYLSRSQQSIESDTSRWTVGDNGQVSGVTALMSTSESDLISSSNEQESTSSTTRHGRPRLQWRLAKEPLTKRNHQDRSQESVYESHSSTQV